VSVLLSHNEVKTLEAASPTLLKRDVAGPTYMSLFNPQRSGWIMIEAFECEGSTMLVASEDYLDLIRHKKSELQVNSTRNSGHLVTTVPVSHEGLLFITNNPVVPISKQSNMVKLKYTWYDGARPYLGLDNFDKTVRFIPEEATLDFNVRSVSSDDARVIRLNYTIYLSNDSNVLRSASQCGSKIDYSQSVILAPTDQPGPSLVLFQIPKATINKISKGSNKYYVSVVCSVEAQKT
jgi:hypothetical protein